MLEGVVETLEPKVTVETIKPIALPPNSKFDNEVSPSASVKEDQFHSRLANPEVESTSEVYSSVPDVVPAAQDVELAEQEIQDPEEKEEYGCSQFLVLRRAQIRKLLLASTRTGVVN